MKNSDNSLYQRISKNFNKTDMVLKTCGKVEDIKSKELKEFISELYESEDSSEKILGSVICHIYFSGKTAFLLSRKLLTDMIENDPNIQEKFKTSEIDGCLAKMKGFILEEYHEPLRSEKGGSWRAGLYILGDEELREIIGADEIAEKTIIHAYEKKHLLGEYAISHSEELRELGAKKQEQIAERKREVMEMIGRK